MKNKFRIVILLIVGTFILIRIDFPVSHEDLEGVYINNNFEEMPIHAEIPYIKDTIIIRKNGIYRSNFYNEGNYELTSGFFSNQMEIKYKDDIEITLPKTEHKEVKSDPSAKNIIIESGREFRIRNRIFQSPRIMLVEDINHFYSKIE